LIIPVVIAEDATEWWKELGDALRVDIESYSDERD
jgi:hypothetical protein